MRAEERDDERRNRERTREEDRCIEMPPQREQQRIAGRDAFEIHRVVIRECEIVCGRAQRIPLVAIEIEHGGKCERHGRKGRDDEPERNDGTTSDDANVRGNGGGRGRFRQGGGPF